MQGLLAERKRTGISVLFLSRTVGASADRDVDGGLQHLAQRVELSELEVAIAVRRQDFADLVPHAQRGDDREQRVDDVVATPLHSTTYALSFSIQLLGKKLWIWQSPAEMEALGTISSHSANFYTGGSEKDFVKNNKVS